MFPVAIDPLISEVFTPSSYVILDDVEKGEEKAKGKQKDDQNGSSQDDDIFSEIVSRKLHQKIRQDNI